MEAEQPIEVDVAQDVHVVEKERPAIVEEPGRVLQPPARVE
jgi:hypothetical protein